MSSGKTSVPRSWVKKFANFVYIVSDYGLFSQDDDPSKGKWLEPARTLNFYPLKNGVSG